MSFVHAIVLGVIQGLTEFLPISSTAHLTLAGNLMGLIDPARPEDWTAFIAILQLGTVAAVIIYFFKDLGEMAAGLLADVSGRTGWGAPSRLAGKVAIGTLPVVVIGLGLKKVIEGTLTKNIGLIATSLVVLALILWWAEAAGARTRTEATWKDALFVGFAQAIALIPGASRSGTTITAGLFAGLTRESAARFSFLLSIPAVVASGLLELYSVRGHLGQIGIAPLLAGTVVAGIVGYSTIAFLLKFLKTHSTYLFIAYRIILGTGLLYFHLRGSL